MTFTGADDGDYFSFGAKNGYEVISRSRMDIQTERLWLLGGKHAEETRSGTMAFSSDAKRDAAYSQFVQAIDEWADHHGGIAVQDGAVPATPAMAQSAAAQGCDYCRNPLFAGTICNNCGSESPRASSVNAQTTYLQDADFKWLQRFKETSEDGQDYDVPKDSMKRLTELGAVQSVGFGRYSITAFGSHVADPLDMFSTLPLKTHADHLDQLAKAEASLQAILNGPTFGGEVA